MPGLAEGRGRSWGVCPLLPNLPRLARGKTRGVAPRGPPQGLPSGKGENIPLSGQERTLGDAGAPASQEILRLL